MRKNVIKYFFATLIILLPTLICAQFKVVNESRAYLELSFENPEFEMSKEFVAGNSYDVIRTKEGLTTIEESCPELPQYSTLIEVPDRGNATIKVKILETKTVNNVNIKPFRVNEQETLSFNKDVYTKDSYYPERIADIGDPAILRNHRIASIVFYPFRYNDAKKELLVITKAIIDVTYDSESGVNELARKRNFQPVREFDNILSKSVVNYDGSMRSDYANPKIIYLYPSSLEGNAVLNQLFLWRRQQGWDVVPLSTADTGSSNSSIKSYIQDAYDNWETPPAYLTIIGDAEGSINIPTFTSTVGYYNIGGDHEYALLEGDDEIEDIFVGRLSVSSTSDLATVVSKTIKYERQLVVPDPEYYQRTLLVGDWSPSGQSTEITCKYVKEIMSDYDDDYEFIEHYGNNPSPAQVSAGLNQKCGYFVYRGYINMDGFGESQINSLNNINALTITTIITCSTGTFYQGTSRTEAFLRAGSAASPKGGVCSVGMATSGTHTAFNNCLNSGIMGYLFQEDGWTMGGAMNRGKLYLWQNYHIANPPKVSFFSIICNLMGDGSLRVWKTNPGTITVDCVDTVASGANQLSIHCEDVGGALDGVWATLNIGDEYISTYTNDYGDAYFDIPTDATGTAKLTVSKEDYIPVQQEITLNGDIPNINIGEVTIFENSSEVDTVIPGNTYQLKIEATNTGTASVENLDGTIFSPENGIAIITNNDDYPVINANSSETNDSYYELTIPNRAFNEEIVLDVTFTSGSTTWKRHAMIPVTCAIAEVQEYTLANDSFAPGEESDVTITIKNVGNTEFSNGSCELSTTDTRLTITGANQTLSNVAVNATGTVTYHLDAAPSLMPSDIVSCKLEITDGEYETYSIVNIQIGEATQTDPLGADSYGYYMFGTEDTDYAECPTYEWIDISEIGEEVDGLNDNGSNQEKIITMDMPFTFRFYGIDYDQVSICSNGYITMGESEVASFRNRRIPGPLASYPLIAPFWDDLRKGTGHTYTYYDSNEHYFVITWDNWSNAYNSSSKETFQVILYDPQFWASSTGDAQIKFQYEDFNNVDSTAQNAHGSYCTIGIEDHTGTVGLEYTYNNEYPTACAQLGDETAIFITTKIGQLPPFVASAPNDITFEEDHVAQIDMSDVFRDPNNDELFYTFSTSDNLTFEQVEEMINVTPNENWNGIETFTITASDNISEQTVSVDILVTVTSVNDRPVMEGKIPEESSFDHNSEIGFKVMVTDVDSELTYEWKVDNVIVENANTDSLHYSFATLGEHVVKCYAADDDFTLTSTWRPNVTSVGNDVEEVVVNNSLNQNIPNPFNPTTTIVFANKKAGNVQINIYNIKGQKVKTLVSDYYSAGNHSIVWNGKDDKNQSVASGTYFYRMTTDGYQNTKKAILLK